MLNVCHLERTSPGGWGMDLPSDGGRLIAIRMRTLRSSISLNVQLKDPMTSKYG